MTDVGGALRAAQSAYGAGDRAAADRLCREVLRGRPDDFDALMLLGVLQAEGGRPADAAALFRRAIAVRPGNAIAHNFLGNSLRELGQPGRAVDSYDTAVRLDPSYVEAYNNRGGALCALGRLDDAVASFDRALALRPDFADAHYNRGVALNDLARVEEAVESFRRAAALRPRFVAAHYNLGNALHALRRYEAAVESFDRALAIDAAFAQAWNNRGNSLTELGRLPEALLSLERAIAVAPRLVDAHKNRATVLGELGRREEALESYRQALEINPHLAGLAGARLHARLQLCDWAGIDAEVAALTAAIGRGEPATGSFLTLAITDDPALQRRVAAGWTEPGEAVARALPPLTAYAAHPRIRVGYFSADFHEHATAYLAAELFELHDRARFETIALSFGPDRQDAMRQRLVGAFERFVDVRALSDREIAELSRRFEIDIAIDLKGYTLHSRPGIFAHRAAPLQVSYLGYPGTMGKPFVDYLVADATLIPAAEREHYSERIIYLPDSYQVNDRQRVIAPQLELRSQLGLSPGAVVLCCFNSAYKITPAVFDSWMRILGAVPATVLWLLGEQPATVDNLRREAERRGIEPLRLVFAGPMPLASHLARYRAADLFLDTFPCGAHTTASDALWAGVPVLTRVGRTFASRVAASLLRALDLADLVTDTPQDYEARAIALARNPRSLSALKDRLSAGRGKSPLFDTPRYVDRFERALTEIYRRRVAGEGPADLTVAGYSGE
jgi:predicted O-linked N-acetylglucosamine transferase (SPINDLY family)